MERKQKVALWRLLRFDKNDMFLSSTLLKFEGLEGLRFVLIFGRPEYHLL